MLTKRERDKFRFYPYVGPKEIQRAVSNHPTGDKIMRLSDLEHWLARTQLKPNFHLIPATFVIDSQGALCIADRHCEHIACAGGESVLSAGEIFFARRACELEAIEVTNQSTGFCPEPDSWFWVEKALNRIPIPHPGHFTTEFIFRRCPSCLQLNLVKQKLFCCAVCGGKLPRVWNCDYRR